MPDAAVVGMDGVVRARTIARCVLIEAGVRVSMDGRGRWMDNVFIERVWRSPKYEDVYLRG